MKPITFPEKVAFRAHPEMTAAARAIADKEGLPFPVFLRRALRDAVHTHGKAAGVPLPAGAGHVSPSIAEMRAMTREQVAAFEQTDEGRIFVHKFETSFADLSQTIAGLKDAIIARMPAIHEATAGVSEAIAAKLAEADADQPEA